LIKESIAALQQMWNSSMRLLITIIIKLIKLGWRGQQDVHINLIHQDMIQIYSNLLIVIIIISTNALPQCHMQNMLINQTRPNFMIKLSIKLNMFLTRYLSRIQGIAMLNISQTQVVLMGRQPIKNNLSLKRPI
jgi:hypothetical protein